MSPLVTLVSLSGLLDLALKSAAVMLLAVGIATLLGKASAAWRHLLWCLSVVSLLLLPALSLALPAWQVAWLPQWTVLPQSTDEPARLRTATQRTPFARTGQTPETQTGAIEPVVAAPTSVTVVPSDSAGSTAATEPLPVTNILVVNQLRGPWPWLAIGWATGALLSLVPLAVGLWQLAALHRRSRVIGDPRWLKLLDELRRQLAVRQSVELRQCEAALAPLTWGAIRPVLLVPAEASAWPDERRRLVLLHELAHVCRWDWLTQLVAHVACAVYWFNPLVWLAARQMRIERERACDDLVLASGARASDYAQELLALAACLSNSRVSPLVAVPMARRGALEDRLRGILDNRRRRAALTTAAVCLGAALAATAIGPLAMLRAAPPESAASDTEGPKEEREVKEQPAAEESTEKPGAKSVTVRGKVVDDATGEPIGQFITQTGKFDPTNPKMARWGYSEVPSSTRDGSFSTTVRWDEGSTARILADGYFPHPVIASAPPADKDEIEVTIRLTRVPDRVRGVVLDHTGKPLKDAAVFAIGPAGLNVAAGQAWSEAPDFGKDDSARPVLTDERGRFELPIGEAISLGVSHAQFDAWPAAIPPSGEITIQLPQPARVEIDLDIDGADKESVIFYQLLSDFMPEFSVGDRGGTVRRLQSSRRRKIANPGKLVLGTLPPGKYQLCRITGRMLERQIFELKPGETKTIEYIRSLGARVRGKVTWPADTKLEGIVVSVLSETSDTVYASQGPAEDGTFLTERIPPGTYQLQAYAFEPLMPERLMNTSPIPPSFEAHERIEVPAEGEVAAPDLALQPIGPVKKPVKEPAEAAKAAVEKPAEKAAEKPAEQPAAKTVTIRGKVVDDVTGEPIERLVTQAGKFDPADPTKVAWGGVETRSEARDGSFSATVRWAEGWTYRILADGYIPQPVLTSAPPAGKTEILVTIRLKRGRNVRGVVLDHAGKPLQDAAVFAIGPTLLNLAAGEAWRHDGVDEHARPVRTDEQGRFELSIGEAKSLAVSHDQFDAWPAAIPANGEVTIQLPEPAKVEIDLDIDGADEESVIFYQLLAHDVPEFAGLQSSREVSIANPGKLSLAALPPGKYQLCRNVQNRLKGVGMGAMLERRYFELQPGETKVIHYVREQGARVRGQVPWPADTKVMGIVISIQEEKPQRRPSDVYEWRTIYASHAAEPDGAFLTERIAPGAYLLVATAYTPLKGPPTRLSTGTPVPSHGAQIKIEVPADGELNVGDLELKPIRKGK